MKLLHQLTLLAAALLIVATACREPPPPTETDSRELARSDPRRPRHEVVESLRADLEAQRHPADGGGRAWLEQGPETSKAVVRSPGRWVIRYEAGPLGVDEGGVVFLQVSPFWGWSTPQTERPEAPGYTEITSDAKGVELEPSTLDQQLLAVRIGGRRLEAGEQLRIVYGAGEGGALADRYAEGDSRFWIAVDGDGDGVRKILADSPGVPVAPGPAARLMLIAASTARPGETSRLTLAMLDAAGNAGTPFTGEVRLNAVLGEEPLTPAGDLPGTVSFTAADLGRRTIEWTAPFEAGVVRVRGRGPGGLEAWSNPLQVTERGARVFWGDLQNHSALSDGTATPEEHFLYARDVAALDVYALTDHDHWGLLFLDQYPSMWQEIRGLNRRFHEPGRFVTLLGYEWTHWIHGHRHVLYFGDEGEVFSSIDPAYDHPEELWEALRGQLRLGRKAMTVAHHSAGGPIATDWTIAPPPDLEPITEVVSVHGSSEAPDSPAVIYQPVAGNFVRDALELGYRLGMIGSSDGHDGHPGLAQLASPTGGLAAILAEELTREAVYEALLERRVYATNGPRIIVRASFAGYRMGAVIPLVLGDEGRYTARGGPVAGIPDDTLVVQAIGSSDIERIDVVRSGTVEGLLCASGSQCSLSLSFTDLMSGEYVYVRIVQSDGGAAWSSPFFFIE